MDVIERVDALIRPSLEDMGYDLVRVHFTGGGRAVLQIMCERTDGSMNLDDCAEVSRTISALLDVEDPIPGAYELEVSSPGVDRPLTRLRDFDRYAGHEAKVELAESVEGRRRYRGIVKGIDGDYVVLALAEGDVALPFSQIKAAKLVLTDALLAAHAAAAPQDGGRAAGNGAGSGQE